MGAVVALIEATVDCCDSKGSVFLASDLENDLDPTYFTKRGTSGC